ncbi:MAG: 4Fe-4S dicluster domain-containing protein [Candidatus Omnitrophica bacterium]|nr:4Fe-4S dicluster domain-containing protein [Candidatus Omnitrophota bacterium]MCM8808730.1 4Fe-4S dicluster domain-containing protein [Candidatus Omnitrophota bacterium]
MERLYIKSEDWNGFIKGKLKENRIYVPIEKNNFLFYEILNEENCEKIIYDRARTIEPLKTFLYPFKEFVVPEIENIGEIIVMGVTSCDLQGLEILDSVFKEGDYKDLNYIKRRENLLIISFDCKEPYSSCFCNLVGVNPYPEKNFDLNLSKIENGFIVEIGSEKGKEFIGQDKRFYQVNQTQIKNLEEDRKKVIEKLEEINRNFDIKNFENLEGMYQKEYWEISDVKNCVSCGSCTFNCPTCVCFLLEDTSDNGNFKKVKVWDSCQFPGYAKMASGETPRPTLYDRYANRLLCKYWYMRKNFNTIGCTGCGRCISGCIGKIDKRKVLSEVLRKKIKV